MRKLNKISILKFVALLIAINLWSAYAFGKNYPTKNISSWVNVGFNLTSLLPISKFVASVAISFNEKKETSLQMYRYQHNSVAFGGGKLNEIGTLWGICTSNNNLMTSYSAGIGLIKADNIWRNNESSEKYSFITVGIPLETQLYWTPLSGFGIGLTGFGSLNFEKSYVGFLFGLKFGDHFVKS